ncbi:uncharacterized protein LOC132396977 isoform X2 [Hypanus sabinus]|uniref:uncharacterized protein LOC132396977 isoform X2 n=1 Tax=Hypanus sabinus TaxID=79690 RepID=UPI0028C463F9|nr:uncharacterized protein LOC132396977 isoform X2 [Hypanus sabinus]
MDVSLCLVLLQLTVAWNSGSGFPVEQPKYIEAVVDESVTLTCTFTHPENSSLRDIDIRWKVRKNHKTDIFRYLDNYTLKDFRGRIKFLGSPLRDKTGSIRLHRVEERDTNMYFCIVVILGEEYTGPGTVLSVQARTGDHKFQVKQMGYLEAAENGSVILPCSFTYPDTYTPRDIHITWKVGGFHGTKIFNSSQNNTFGEYRGRIEFLGSPLRNKTGSIRLVPLKANDSNFYFCRVTCFNVSDKSTEWQSISGTFLSVRANIKKENYNLGPAVSGDKNVRQCQKDGSGLPHNYDMPNMVATEGESPEGIVYSVVQAKERPKTVRSVAHSEEKCLYMDVKFQAETQ